MPDNPRRLDEAKFTRYLTGEGYSEDDAEALIDSDEAVDAEQLDVKTRDGQTVTVEVDWSGAHAGQVEFIMPGASDA